VSEPIQHHYVPRVYLESFAGEDGKIWTYDKSTKRIFSAKPKETAKKGDYNTFTSVDGRRDRKTIEEFFEKLETKLPQLIVKASARRLDFEAQLDLIKLCLLQIIRSPMTRDLLTILATKIAPHDERSLSNLGVNETGIDILRRARNGERSASDELSLRVSNDFLQSITGISERLDYYLVSLGKSNTFVISDCPAIILSFRIHRNGKWVLDLNIPNRRTILLYPITPTILLFGDNLHRRSDRLFNFQYGEINNAISIAKLASSVLLCCARRQIYAPSETILLHEIDRIEKENRSLVQSNIAIATHCQKLVRMLYSQMCFPKDV
jgi:hypothetical protein